MRCTYTGTCPTPDACKAACAEAGRRARAAYMDGIRLRDMVQRRERWWRKAGEVGGTLTVSAIAYGIGWLLQGGNAPSAYHLAGMFACLYVLHPVWRKP